MNVNNILLLWYATFETLLEQVMEMVPSFLKDRRAVAPVVTALVTLMVAIFVGIIIIVNLINSVSPDTTWSTEANDTWDSLQANTWVAFLLLAIIPIIAGAVTILAYLRFGKK